MALYLRIEETSYLGVQDQPPNMLFQQVLVNANQWQPTGGKQDMHIDAKITQEILQKYGTLAIEPEHGEHVLRDSWTARQA